MCCIQDVLDADTLTGSTPFVFCAGDFKRIILGAANPQNLVETTEQLVRLHILLEQSEVENVLFALPRKLVRILLLLFVTHRYELFF